MGYRIVLANVMAEDEVTAQSSVTIPAFSASFMALVY
jgi:hypothetical protein